MIGFYTLTAVALIAAAAVVAILVVVVLGIRREERNSSLTSNRTDRVTRSARRLTGAGSRLPDGIQDVNTPRQEFVFAGQMFAGQEGRIR